MDITLTDIERQAYKQTPIHDLDGRVKLIMVIAIIVYSVWLSPLEYTNLYKLGALELYLIILMAIARLNPIYVLLRLLVALPFGTSIVALQPFVRHSFLDKATYYPIDLPFGLAVTYEGLFFGGLLFAKFLVCVSAIILLSSTTRMNEMVAAARRLGIPAEFTLLLTMMVRYLFLFWVFLKRIRTAQKVRLFYIWNKKVPRKWILRQVAYTISSLFIRSYEQGERTYISMLCRGYKEDGVYLHKEKLRFQDFTFLTITAGLLIVIQLYV
ncbi:cobalt ECF transporter T component CbiQ [Methanohalophilus sp.]|uniref:cobalt ECF transporter T component CbiQ n=1 Tax=Methanohalophilus sp. TaxID=1966352 RepID=UPI00262BC8C7|nr:cobalt ECF transporter T component CbiQ [Methanohalophilus sp.]MDK2892545.1 cobalt/nickel transport system permease protein [Methanohalophilus sp.]